MMIQIKQFFLIIFIAILTCNSYSQKLITTSNHNPLLPGYFADPTIKKFGDTYYIYSTTDGIKLASGAPTVWISKDFKNWYNYKLDIKLPEGLNNCWAPDIVYQNGKYYYYMGNCEYGCNIYGYVSDSPMGPFEPVNNGKPVIRAGISKKDLPALDAQFLKDDDGLLYAYFGTWCTSFGGMGFAQIDTADMYSIVMTNFIPINQIPKAFEGAYPFKHNGKYYLTYSSGDCRLSSYAVNYSVSDKPQGPFIPGKNNPILQTNNDSTVDGPGHHSVVQIGKDFLIVYHRHDNPHSTDGEFRQVCADNLVFSGDEIEKVIPTHTGVSISNEDSLKNLAFEKKVSASSAYHLISAPTKYSPEGYNYCYSPKNITDDDNGTLWKAMNADVPQWITIDLGKSQSIKRIFTEFEYPTYYYQYKIEISEDSIHWNLFSDKTTNKRCGSPMIDDHNAEARYVKITVTGTEKTGMIPAIWNVKIYNAIFVIPSYQNPESIDEPGVPASKQLLVDFDASKLSTIFDKIYSSFENKGTLGGKFIAKGYLAPTIIEGIKGLRFGENNHLQLSKKAPKSLSWNAPFTVAVWMYAPKITNDQCLVVWDSRENMLQSSYAALMFGLGHYGAVAHGDYAVDLPYKTVPEQGKWHHVVVTFDGALENIYVDGELDTQQPISLFVENGDILIGASGEPSENFNGYIARAQIYNKSMTQKEIIRLMNETKPRITK